MREQVYICLLALLLWGLCGPIYSQSISRTDSLQQALHQAASDMERTQLLLKLAKELETRDIKKSLAYAQEAEQISMENNFSEEYREALMDIGSAYFRLGLMEESVKYRTLYLDLIEASGSAFEKTIAYVNLGGNWVIKGDLKKGEELFLKSLELFKASTPPKKDLQMYQSALPTIYNNLGYIYRETGKHDQAEHYINLGLAYCKKYPELKDEYLRLLNNQSLLYTVKNMLTAARDVLNEALQLSIAQHNSIMEITGLYDLSKVYDKLGHLDSAILISQKGLALSTQLDNPSLIFSLAEQLSGLYERKQVADSALKYLNLSKKYDSLMKREEAKELLIRHQLHTEFEEKEKKAQAAHIRKQYQIGGMAIFLALAAFFTFFKYLQSRKKIRVTQLAKLETQLAADKLVLEKALLEQEIESREKKMATDVMYQIRKNEMINGVVQKLMEHSQQLKSESRELISDIIRDLEKTQEKSVWTEFEVRFQDVHKHFYDQLQQLHPDLSANERRLCAFLKLNMSTKEISTITGQSFHSINVARTRLRKKLKLTHSEKGLVEYLAAIG